MCIRDSLDGNEVSKVKVGAEAVVELSIQGHSSISNAVIVDLLPGGFDLVWSEWSHPDFSSDLSTQYVEKREDRVVVYSSVSPDLNKFYYKIKAVSVGEYTFPGVYFENMYKTKEQALSKKSKLSIIE